MVLVQSEKIIGSLCPWMHTLLDYYIRTTSTELVGMCCIDDDMQEGNGSKNNANNKESRMSSVD